MEVTNEVKVKLIDFTPPYPTAVSTVYEAGNYLEVVTTQSPQGNLAQYRRIDKHSYVDQSTGELKHYRYRAHSAGDASAHRRSFRMLQRTIYGNFVGAQCELHIVLTVAPEFDATLPSMQLYYRKFWKRFHYRYPCCEYIAIAEVHQSGRYHFHVLLKDSSFRPLFIPNATMQQLWQVGYTKTVRITNVDGLGSYFCGKSKQERWAAAHQPGYRLFRCSKGIVHPVGVKMSRKEVGEYVKQAQFRRVYSCTRQIVQACGDGTERKLNTITHERFRR